MPVFYVDTSAIVKRYRSEQGTEVVDELLENAHPEDRFYTSFLCVLEVTSAIQRLVASGQLEEAVAQELLARFRRDLRERFRLWPLSNDVVASAVAVVEQHKLRSADAIHLASALSIYPLVQESEVVMVSSDRHLIRSARVAGLAALCPTDTDALSQLRQLRRPQR